MLVLNNRLHVSSHFYSVCETRQLGSLVVLNHLFRPLTLGAGLHQHCVCMASGLVVRWELYFGQRDCWKIALQCLVNFFEIHAILPLALLTPFLTSNILCRPARTLNIEISVGRLFIFGLRDCWKIALKCLANLFGIYTIVLLALFQFWLFFFLLQTTCVGLPEHKTLK